MPENIAILTTSRAEYYQLRPVIKAIQNHPRLTGKLFVSGSHLSGAMGSSEDHIIKDGCKIAARLPILADGDSGMSCVRTSSSATSVIGEAMQKHNINLLLVAGDRYEILAAALAATCLNIPIAHIHGGERTDGVMDDSCRHAITKLSALHFTSTDVYRARVMQMGEEPGRVFTTGAPLVDNILATPLLTKSEVAERLNIVWQSPIALVAYHPVTRSPDDDAAICQSILESTSEYCRTVIVSAPNCDPGHSAIARAIKDFSDRTDRLYTFDNLGSQLFLSIMALADIMVGNSSSGIHEAASFGLPVVNIGSRQHGRLSPGNVIHTRTDTASIRQGIKEALTYNFSSRLNNGGNPYGHGDAGKKIVRILESFIPLRTTLLQKSFVDGQDVVCSIQNWNGHYAAIPESRNTQNVLV